MIKKKNKHDDLDNSLFDDISIEEIDKDIDYFVIDKEKIDSIKYSFDKDTLIKNSIDKAEKDIKLSKLKKNIIKVASFVIIILSIGVYNPALAHNMPLVMDKLEKINDFLKVDEISSYIGLDKIIPKAILDNDNNIEFIKMSNYKVSSKNNSDDKVNLETVDDKLLTEYEVIDFIHKMANQIINARDGKKFGIVDITPDNIEIALKSIENIKNDDVKVYLNTALNKWKIGDFSNGVFVHNYVWNILNGEIGIASSLNESKIDEILNKYFK